MSWDKDQQERSFTDHAAGKPYGKTYEEATFDKLNKLHAQEDARQKAQEKSFSSTFQGKSSSDGSQVKSGSSTPAKKAAYVGWGLLVVSLLLVTGNVTYTPIAGISITKITAIGGVAFLVLGYFAQLIALVIYIFLLWFVYSAGKTPDGFQIGAVPMKVWLIAVILAIGAFILGVIFSRD